MWKLFLNYLIIELFITWKKFQMRCMYASLTGENLVKNNEVISDIHAVTICSNRSKIRWTRLSILQNPVSESIAKSTLCLYQFTLYDWKMAMANGFSVRFRIVTMGASTQAVHFWKTMGNGNNLESKRCASLLRWCTNGELFCDIEEGKTLLDPNVSNDKRWGRGSDFLVCVRILQHDSGYNFQFWWAVAGGI